MSGPPCGAGRDCWAWGRCCGHGTTVTRSRVRGKHPFDFPLTSNRRSTKVSVSPGWFDRTAAPPSRPGASCPPAADHPAASPALAPQEHRRWPRRSPCPSVRPVAPASAAARPPSPSPSARAATEPPPSTGGGAFVAAAVGLGLVLTAAQAGAALGGSTLASPERRPHVADRRRRNPATRCGRSPSALAPGADPRDVVDALRAGARHRRAASPGETLTWLDD